jgi:hypothetical protein
MSSWPSKLASTASISLLHGQLLVLKDQLLDGRQGVHHGAEAHVFKVAEVDALGDLLLVQVDAVLHAQVVHGREPMGWAKQVARRLLMVYCCMEGRFRNSRCCCT